MKSKNWKPASHLRWTQQEGETVVVDSQEGKVYRFNGVGAAVWNALQTVCDEAGIAAKIALDFEAPVSKIQKDTRAFLAQLHSQDLIEPAQNV